MTTTARIADGDDWFPNPDGAGRFRVLRDHGDGGVTVEVTMPAGSVGRTHRHPAGEELVMLDGEAKIGSVGLQAGDYLYTPPGATHRAEAVTDCRFVLVLPAVPEYL